MAVLDGSYLIGKIVEVNYSTSRALLISDLNSKIPVIIEPGSVKAILSGTGKEHGKIEYLEKEIDIKDKSTVYTSGSGGLFKAGIPIGIYNKGNLDIENSIKFFSKLSQLTFVQLVLFKEENY
jgi:rod shape-determining protein MreC